MVSPGSFRTDFLDASSVRFAEGSIEEYSDGVSAFRAFHEGRNHKQSGDPAKLARVILKLAQADKPPVSFVAGSDAVGWAVSAIQGREAQLAEWRSLSISTDGG